MQLFLVHHGDAVGPEVDPQRPLSPTGRDAAARKADEAARRGARPAIVWHSGKLRARQTAEIFWRACNALADFAATRDMQPDDPPSWIRDRMIAEPRDIMLVGHFPHLPRLLGLLLSDSADAPVDFPKHGVVALVNADGVDEDGRWSEAWRIA